MDLRIGELLVNFPQENKHFITSNESVVSSVARLLNDKIVPIYGNSEYNEVNNFYTDKVINVTNGNNEIAIVSFHFDSTWYIIISAASREIINAFLDTIRDPTIVVKKKDRHLRIEESKKEDITGYILRYYDCLDYDKGIHITNSLNFEYLLGLDDIRNNIIADIDNYRNHMDKHQIMGTNTGLNFVFYGNSGIGKHSFVKALALHYHADLLICPFGYGSNEIAKTFNPKVKKFSIVLINDISSKETYAQLMDIGHDNLVRIFVIKKPIRDELITSRCCRVVKFPDLTVETINAQISRVFNVPPEESHQLAELIKTKATEHSGKSRPLNYRDLNKFLCRFFGVLNPVTSAIAEIESNSIIKIADIPESDRQAESQVVECSIM